MSNAAPQEVHGLLDCGGVPHVDAARRHGRPSATAHIRDFAAIQDDDGEVDIVAGADGGLRVVASGRTPAGLKVDWITPGSGSAVEHAVRRRFLDAVAAEYGPRITTAVARELELDAGIASPLPTRAVKAALRMAETQRDVFSGANFFVDLHCSAEARTPAFLAAYKSTNIDAAALTPDDLKAIDQRLRAATARASQENREPLSPADGERLLPGVLTQWLADRPPSLG